MKNTIRVAAAVALMLAACNQGPGDHGPTPKPTGPISVIAGHAPLAELAQKVVGDLGDVLNLAPPGGEAHDLELTPQQIDAIGSAEIVVFSGEGFQPSVAAAIKSSKATVIDTSKFDDDPDPHLWLDPVSYASIASSIQQAAATARPDSGAAFITNVEAAATEIAGIDESYRNKLSDCLRNLIVTTHDAFGRLADRYGLRTESIQGTVPEGEADPKRIDELTNLIRQNKITHVFTGPGDENGNDPARTLAQNAGVATAVLDPIETITEGSSWSSIMASNLKALDTALDCRPE